MSYDRLYKPEPCTFWPAAQLRAVGTAYRDAAGRGLDAATCLERATSAYVTAGGPRSEVSRVVLDMIASLAMEEGDWLWGPAQALRDRQRSSEDQPDLFAKPSAETT